MVSGIGAFAILLIVALAILVVGLVVGLIVTPRRHEQSIDRYRRPPRE